MPSILTNGLKLADRSYVRELKQAGLHNIYLSMNGGFDDDLYAAIDAMRCAEQKRQAFDNLRAEYLCTSIGMILIRGINEHAVENMLEAVRSARNVRELHLRSIGSFGRFMSNRPFVLKELIDIFAAACGVPAAQLNHTERTASSYDLRLGRQRVQLTQWPDLGSESRGRLTPEGMIALFFEHVIANEGGY